MKALAEKVRMLISKKMWLVLTTLDGDTPYSSVMVYQSDGQTIICQTGVNTLKANNIRKNSKVAITIPIRKNFFHKLLPAPPAELHFTTTADILSFDNEEARNIFARFLKHTEKNELPQDSIWISIKVPKKVTTYGIAVPLLKMRKPLLARKIVHLNS